MCGIFGLLPAPGATPQPGLLERMAGAIRHRGPDSAGFLDEPGIRLGMVRLSIVDLATGDQPIFNEDRSLAIVYNGEVYNHAEIRGELQAKGHAFATRSDTETILHAFEEWGPDCLPRFNGMFAFAIWNRTSHRLFLARDRLGIKPLYLHHGADGLAFASEAKALLPLLPGGPRADITALARFLCLGYVPSPLSPFAGLEKLPPGHFAWAGPEGFTAQRWWSPAYGLGESMSPDRAAARLEELMDQAVRLELMADVPLGVFLSGGLDSSAVAHYAVKNSGSGMHSFALAFTEATHDESADARAVAQHLGTEHHELTFTADLLDQCLEDVAQVLDEPFGDSTVLPLLAISRFAKERVKVVLTGWGGDEIFAGYPTYKAHLMAARYRRLPALLSRGLIPAVVRRLPVSDKYMSLEFKAKRFIMGMDLPPELQHFLWMGYFRFDGLDALLTPRALSLVEEGLPEAVRRMAAELPERDVVSRIMHLDALTFLEGNGLFQADRMTMAASLEARVPLLNIDLLDFVNQLPADVKMPGGALKGLLKRTLAPHLPAHIISKPKKGFGPPSAAWTRGRFFSVLQNLYTRDRVEADGMFRYSAIVRLLEEHATRKADHGRVLWALLSLGLWRDRFLPGLV